MSYTNLLLKGFCNMYQKMAALKYDLCALFFRQSDPVFSSVPFFFEFSWKLNNWNLEKF